MSSIQISSQVRATLTSFWNQRQVLEMASHPGKVTRTWTLAHMCTPSFGHHISHRCDQLTARIYLKELYKTENIQLLQVKIHNSKIHKFKLENHCTQTAQSLRGGCIRQVHKIEYLAVNKGNILVNVLLLKKIIANYYH